MNISDLATFYSFLAEVLKHLPQNLFIKIKIIVSRMKEQRFHFYYWLFNSICAFQKEWFYVYDFSGNWNVRLNSYLLFIKFSTNYWIILRRDFFNSRVNLLASFLKMKHWNIKFWFRLKDTLHSKLTFLHAISKILVCSELRQAATQIKLSHPYDVLTKKN